MITSMDRFPAAIQSRDQFQMDPCEYANMEQMESAHWYYAGKRDFVRAWLLRTAAMEKQHVLLDCGAGTGRFAKEMEAYCRVLVLDDHEEALAYLRQRFAPDQILSLAGD